MSKVRIPVMLPDFSSSQKFNMEVEATSDGKLNITIPKQVVKSTSNCYVPFSELLTNTPIQFFNKALQDRFQSRDTATAKTVSGRRVLVDVSIDELMDAVRLALAACYCQREKNPAHRVAGFFYQGRGAGEPGSLAW